MKRILYISGLVKRKRKYDGERIKNTLIYNSLREKYDVSLINLSIFKLFNTIRIFFHALFDKNRFDYVVISKDPHGANIIHKLLLLAKYPPERIIYFEIGPFLFDRINNGSIDIRTFNRDRLIVVETESMKKELCSLGFNNIDVFPNFKPWVDIPFNKKIYPVSVLRLVYLSRIEEMKGIYDLIDVLVRINDESIKFTLDIYGRPQSREDEIQIANFTKKYSYIKYCGKLDVGDFDSYKLLSSYDLHVFPTKYTEGFPGTLIDFFIAGVPTLSSSFARSHEILSEEDSIIYRQFDNEDLLHKLQSIYDNQDILIGLRNKSYLKRNEFSSERFEKYVETIIV